MIGGSSACSQADSADVRTFDACQPLHLIIVDEGERVASVDAAIASWSAVGMTTLSRGDGDLDEARLPIRFTAGASSEFGLYTGDEIAINDQLTGDALGIVIAHEIGHAFGLVHISPDARSSVMNPRNLATGPTLDDDAAIAAIWGSCH